jgi:hypothetical protein
MRNLTSYHAPALHLNCEFPKSYCDLIQDINEKDCINSTPPHRYFDHQFSDIYQKHAGDCYKENDKKRINISHFRLR